MNLDDFNGDSSFVVWAVRNSNQKVSQSSELYCRRYSTSKVAILVLRNFRYPIQRRFFPLRSITATCGRGEKVVRIRARLNTKKIFLPFVVRNYFGF